MCHGNSQIVRKLVWWGDLFVLNDKFWGCIGTTKRVTSWSSVWFHWAIYVSWDALINCDLFVRFIPPARAQQVPLCNAEGEADGGVVG